MSSALDPAFPAARLDKPTRLVSAAFAVALMGLALTAPAAVGGGTAGALWGAGPIAVIALAYGFSPVGYRMAPDGAMYVVRRWFGGKTFRVHRAQTVSALFGLGGLRLTGSAGAFGWYGLFWRSETGRYRAYVTDRTKLVACEGPDGLVIVSPDDPEAFLAAVPAV